MSKNNLLFCIEKCQSDLSSKQIPINIIVQSCTKIEHVLLT